MVTMRPFTETFTPSTTGTGFLPMRLISLLLPNLAQHFAPQVLLAGLAVAHHAARRAENLDSEPVEHGPQLAGLAVDPLARLAHALQVPNEPLAVGTVLEIEL